MRVRDRLIVAVIAAAVVAGIVWLALVSPKRGEASSLSAQITAEQSALTTAQATLASDRAVAAGYPGDVRALAQVTMAVPTSVDEPTVITTITKLAGTKVDVHELDISAPGAGASGETQVGLSFSFITTYQSLQDFLVALDRLTRTDGTNIAADGRLFTVSGVSFTPDPPEGTKVTVTAAAYAQSPTAVATPLGATGASGATGATSATATSAATP